jgi:hypothetical protein
LVSSFETPSKKGSIPRITIFSRCTNHKLDRPPESLSDAKKFIDAVRASYAQNTLGFAAMWSAVPSPDGIFLHKRDRLQIGTVAGFKSERVAG